MIDIVFPDNNEQEFIDLALRLGLKGLVFVYSRPTKSTFKHPENFFVDKAIVCRPDEVRKYKSNNITICIAPDDQSKIRTVIEQSKPHILLGLESSSRRDFMHHRASGLNHVMANLCKEKGVCVGMSFSDIITSPTHRQSLIIGRMLQNARFSKKFGFCTVIASFAKDPYMLRAPKDLESFFVALGMDKEHVKRSLGWKER
jgi:RNase P/RNase MRP subunit p30